MTTLLRKALLQFRVMPARYFRSSSPSSGSHNLTIVTQENGVRRITMNNPKKRNALSLHMLEDLTEDMVSKDDDLSLRCIVIAAEGPVFSAGHDLKELADTSKQAAVFAECSELMAAIRESPVPVMCAVRGLAAAAGCQLVAATDIAICTESSSFSTPGANFGVFCSTPGIAVVRAVPRQVANLMLFTGEPLSAQRALQAGLVAKVTSDEELESEVQHIAGTIIAKSRSVVTLGKMFLGQQVELDVATAYRLGEEVMCANLELDDGQEGLASFIEKRKAKWSHQ